MSTLWNRLPENGGLPVKMCNRLLILLLPLSCASILLATPNLVHAQAAVVGVNLLNEPYNLTAAEQNSILDAMKEAGVRVIRTGIIENSDRGLDYAKRVSDHGIKIEWLAGVRGPSGNMILSVADPGKFRADFQPWLAKLESKGIVFAGIELGSEINWALWNNDLSGKTGRVLGLDDLSRDPEGQQVAKGYINYIKLLATLKDIRDHSQLNQHTPIISAGLAPWEPPATGSKNDAVSLNATIQFLHANGVEEAVDAYGIHWYPRGNVTPAARLSAMQLVFAECASGQAKGKPCWLTEWGLPAGDGKTCPVVDDGRAAVYSELRNDFRSLVQQGRLKGIIYYTWEGNIHDPNYKYDPYSIYLCGGLSKGGRVALAPF